MLTRYRAHRKSDAAATAKFSQMPPRGVAFVPRKWLPILRKPVNM
jgi:hypothetical protein